MKNSSLKKDDKDQKLPDNNIKDEVDEASIESFPASDPPGWINKKPEHEKDEKKK